MATRKYLYIDIVGTNSRRLYDPLSVRVAKEY